MKKQYCTLKNSKLIWEIENVDNNKVYLTMNNKKLNTTLDNIILLDNYVPDIKNEININLRNTDTTSEIMLRHKTKADAMEELDRFIDRALSAGLARVKIIHGKNGGIIRNAVHDYLENSPYISSYNFGDYHEGGFGVTIAYIKRYN